MKVVTTFHPPSSVVRSIKCSLSLGQEHLVIAKINKLEVYSLQPADLHHQCSLEIWGRITSLRALPLNQGGISNLLVLTDHPDPRLITLTYSVNEEGVASLASKEHIELHDRYARPAEFVTDVFVDTHGTLAVVSCYTGKLKVVQYKNGALTGVPFDISIPELYLLALTLLHTPQGTYTLVLLHYDYQQRLQLLARDIDLDEVFAPRSLTLNGGVLSSSTFPASTLEAPLLLIPVPPHTTSEMVDVDEEGVSSHLGGVLVLGGRQVLFVECASPARQDVRKGKQHRSSARTAGADAMKAAKAREKEKEREERKVKPRAGVKWPWSEVVAWCQIDEEGRRYLIGDAYGRLAMLAFNENNGLVLIPLGETSPATSLTYLASQFVYLGSHLGDAQLLRIHPTPIADLHADTLPIPSGIATVPPSALSGGKGKERVDVDMDGGKGEKAGRIVASKGSYVEVIESFQNIAPIVDAALVDLDGSGQPQVITCSGGQNTGALKVIRTGADFQEKAAIESVTDVVGIWTLRSRYEDTIDTHLVASTLRETYVFRLDSANAVTRLDSSANGLHSGLPTLAVKNVTRRVQINGVSTYVDSTLVVQVTPEKVNVVEYEPALGLFTRVGEGWLAQQEGGNRSIAAVDVNASQIVLGLSGGRLVLLNLTERGQVQKLLHRDFTDASFDHFEISAISCAPFDSTKKFTKHVAVSFWGTNKVEILSLDSKLTTLCKTDSLPALPRSLLLYNFGSGRSQKEADFRPYLLVGLTDGSVVTYSFKEGELKDKKLFALGTAPVSFTTCNIDGRTALFASGSRAAVLYWDRQRLQQSPVMLKEAVIGASFNSAAFPSSLLLATSSSLVIGCIRGVDKVQIKSISLGLDNPRRIAHHPASGAFAVACKTTIPPRVGEFQDAHSTLKILEDSTFNQIATFTCEPDEEISAVLALPEPPKHLGSCFCVGTVQFQAGQQEPSSGRILLFALDKQRDMDSAIPELRLVASTPVKGCVYQLVSIEEVIIAAVNTSVVLLKTNTLNGSPSPLSQVTEWNHSYLITSMVAKGNTLVIGDAISSVAMLKVVNTELRCIARDYAPLWPVAVEVIGDEGVIGANSDCNLFTFSLQQNGSRHILDRDGSYHLGDVVNKLLPGGITSTDTTGNSTVHPRHLFFASTGRIGAILEMSDDISLHLTALQRNMAKTIIGPGDTHHTNWRAPVTSRGRSDAESAFGFLDGDFIEQWLTSSNPNQYLEGEIDAERVTLPPSQIQDVLEKLQSLH
ncbi:hypothetical protein WOLCODRAFT_67201 [Wolfiporia cocos MD-104 SS10]|uniref:DNA damage-binding protein 1 n=1 Tax=Wolfiporia cocos (strain MD-104) TaxID=742152 RepID=A0A2H3JD47_WOLCO|nr:hypothetical protein WOLCODRAFT_67201 [Wolfiporia cocos MD-104 SS10]